MRVYATDGELLRMRALAVGPQGPVPGEVVDQYDQVIFHKRCYDPFAEPRVDRILTELEATEFILVGAPVQGAVRATALGLSVHTRSGWLMTPLRASPGRHRRGAA